MAFLGIARKHASYCIQNPSPGRIMQSYIGWQPASQSFLGLLGLATTSRCYGLCGMELCLARSVLRCSVGASIDNDNWLPTTPTMPTTIGMIPGPDSPTPPPTPSRAPPWANRHLPTHPPGCMAWAGITKPSPQSGHVRRAVVPRSSLSVRKWLSFHKQITPRPI